jgi:hypothetical protein
MKRQKARRVCKVKPCEGAHRLGILQIACQLCRVGLLYVTCTVHMRGGLCWPVVCDMHCAHAWRPVLACSLCCTAACAAQLLSARDWYCSTSALTTCEGGHGCFLQGTASQLCFILQRLAALQPTTSATFVPLRSTAVHSRTQSTVAHLPNTGVFRSRRVLQQQALCSPTAMRACLLIYLHRIRRCSHRCTARCSCRSSARCSHACCSSASGAQRAAAGEARHSGQR